MASLSNFGEQFADRVLRRFYQDAVVDAVVNRDYEGEINKPGDRVNILSFLNEAELGDYTVGSDMTLGRIIDAEDVLTVEKRKYYNFSLDRLEDLFTYAGDIPEALVTQHAQKLAETVDTYVLDAFGSDVKAGNLIGTNLIVTAGTQTMASLTTTATGGTITIEGEFDAEDSIFGTVENPLDGNLYNGGFSTADLYKGVRLLSTRAIVSPWWRISGITSTVAATITEWDGAVSGPDFAEGYTLRGVFGGDGTTFPKYTDHAGNDVGSWVAKTGFGWEIQAAIATAVSASNIFDHTTLLAEKLDAGEIPSDDRYLVLPPWGVTALRQASELQPTGIEEIYRGNVINGRVMRITGFDVVKATGARVSARAGHPTGVAIGGDHVITAGATGYFLGAAHKSFITFAEKWTESRVVNAEDQFAKKYQGLFLFGKKVPALRRKSGAAIFGNV